MNSRARSTRLHLALMCAGVAIVSGTALAADVSTPVACGSNGCTHLSTATLQGLLHSPRGAATRRAASGPAVHPFPGRRPTRRDTRGCLRPAQRRRSPRLRRWERVAPGPGRRRAAARRRRRWQAAVPGPCGRNVARPALRHRRSRRVERRVARGCLPRRSRPGGGRRVQVYDRSRPPVGLARDHCGRSRTLVATWAVRRNDRRGSNFRCLSESSPVRRGRRERAQ